MPRPRKRRRVGFMPRVTYFQPVGLDEQLQEELITVDEIEALRLKDLEGLDQETCAAEMEVAQSTFQRILTAARKKLSRAILEGKAIRIEGGDYRLIPYQLECGDCGYGWMHTAWPVRGGGSACPRCGGKGRRWRGGWNDK
ncbi:DUF134 domain-containing protein [Desulfallas sp. Bu1-1]|uniref:DUF134 domain-containing protein n=1 Tax=Desulfallas sp. Bu1-1 TaxID=2787620 RepID=UPI00189F4C44|nr:DUF134 domain-containing protein [Desulfallas sp. Bu1-1]MBF7083741.1 DUF134 domain-containing protein [Desulfallas sp. Bu1-1]